MATLYLATQSKKKKTWRSVHLLATRVSDPFCVMFIHWNVMYFMYMLILGSIVLNSHILCQKKYKFFSLAINVGHIDRTT